MRYKKYKDSGIEWIGEIPEHWETGIIKRYCKVTDGSHYSPKTQLTGKPYISVKDVRENYIDFDNCKKISNDDYNMLVKNGCSPNNGDVLLTKDGTIGRAVIVTENHPQFVALSSLGIVTPKNKVISKYLYFYLISGLNISQMYRTIHGSALTRLTIDKISNLIFIYPHEKEQTAIANYLDHKTAEIDDLIAKKEKLLELYEEEKTAVINSAVTGKISMDNGKLRIDNYPLSTVNYQFKESGVEWLGDIPAHWKVKKLSYCFEKIGSGTTPTSGSPKYYFNGSVNWLQTGDLNDNEITETSKKITHTALDDYTTLRFYPIGSIVIAMYGATIGKTGLLKIETTTNQACCVLAQPIYLISKFVFYWLNSIKMHIISLSYGGGQPNINQEMIRFLKIQLPPKKEQTTIVAHIEKESARIDAKISKTQKLIELLKEYRTALISEAVTGKINVRNC